MGGAQPLAAAMNDACFLGIELDRARIQKRLDTGYCNRLSTNLDQALDLITDSRQRGHALSVGLLGNCAECSPKWPAASCRMSSPPRPAPTTV